MYEYCAECAYGLETNDQHHVIKEGCRTYKDVDGSTFEDCEAELIKLGWRWDEDLVWICKEHVEQMRAEKIQIALAKYKESPCICCDPGDCIQKECRGL